VVSHSSFYEFWEKSSTQALKKDIIAHSTWMKEMTTLNQLMAFSPTLSFAGLVKDFIIGFDKWEKKKGKAQNTRWCYWKHINKFCNQAIEAGHMLKNPCTEYPVRSAAGEIVALRQAQVKALYKYYQGDEITTTEKNVLQHFLFSCFTGLRISDIHAITLANIKGDELIFTPVKGRSHAPKILTVPLHDIARSFILQARGKVFNRVCADQPTNRVLKRIAGKLEIPVRITTHVARHTFATTYLERGGQVEVLQGLMGHTNIKDTMKYVHVTESRKRDQIAVFDGFFKTSSFPETP
jgi:integrase/recombinase XerD